MDRSHDRLGSALIGYFGTADARIERSRYRRWASATFAGGRHSFILRTAGDDLADATSALDEHDFAATGLFVADIRTVSLQQEGGEALVEIEALTVDPS
jgi:hypothetical protein